MDYNPQLVEQNFKQTYGIDPRSAYLYYLADLNKDNKYGSGLMSAYLDSISPETQLKRQQMINEVFPGQTQDDAKKQELDLTLATNLIASGDPDSMTMGRNILNNYYGGGATGASGAAGGGPNAGAVGKTPYDAFIEAAQNRAKGMLTDKTGEAYNPNDYRKEYALGNISQGDYNQFVNNDYSLADRINSVKALQKETGANLATAIPLLGQIYGLGRYANAALNPEAIRDYKLGLR